MIYNDTIMVVVSGRPTQCATPAASDRDWARPFAVHPLALLRFRSRRPLPCCAGTFRILSRVGQSVSRSRLCPRCAVRIVRSLSPMAVACASQLGRWTQQLEIALRNQLADSLNAYPGISVTVPEVGGWVPE
jgi:hypothetical protein